ncbi:MAG: hypothetical protein WD894_10810 [Pirellulales bacterium]
MTIPVELNSEEIRQLKELTKLDNEAAAVSQAARDYVRLRRLRELKSVSGKVDFEDNWRELESLEDDELGFPQ